MEVKDPSHAAAPDTAVAEIRALFAQGRDSDAGRLLEDLLARHPDHVEGLNLSAAAALRAGRLDRAGQLLERARAVDPHNVVTLTNLGAVRRAAGDWEAAVDTYRQALELRRDLYVARLHQGESLERLGRTHQALLAYLGAIRHAQEQGRWLNAATTGAGLRPLVEHAVKFVRRGQREVFETVVSPLRERHGRSALARVEACIANYLGERRDESRDPRQRPTFLHFPGLRAQPYFPRESFDWIPGYEARTQDILAELHDLSPDTGREAVFLKEDVAAQNLRNSGGGKPQWDGYYFHRHGERRDDNCTRCPQTTAALDALPLARVPGHGPEVMFSVLAPGTHLLPHRGVTNTRLVSHLPLIVPGDCALNVAGQLHEWRPGRAVVFDDTYEHEAWNRSGSTRIVLIADIWNPQLTEAERDAVSALVVAIGELRLAADGGASAYAGH